MSEQPALFTEDELPGHPAASVREAVDTYQTFAKSSGWRTVEILDDSRQKAVGKALKIYGGLAAFKRALERASKSSFITGKTGREGRHANWKASLDFFLQPKSIRALCEGAYDDPPGGIKPVENWREKQAREAREQLARIYNK